MNNFDPHSREIKYFHDEVNIFCFSSFLSALFEYREYVSNQAIVLRIKSPLLCESFGYKDRIRFDINSMSDNTRMFFEKCHIDKLHQWGEILEFVF